MKKICFVCLGNICRSPMAELLFKDLIKKEGVEKEYKVVSRATSLEEAGNGVYYLTKPIYDRLGIDYSNHCATKLLASDYEEYDIFIGMDYSNLANMKRLFNGDKDNKVKLLLDYTGEHREVFDPWFSRDFERAYQDINKGVNAFYKYLQKK